MIRRIALLALLAAALARLSSAQGELAAAFASQVRTDVAVLASQPALATWQKSHAGKLELAHYETYKDPYQEDFRRLDRWCAASVGQSPAQVVRAALFYVPSVVNGALPPLPEKEDATLTRACRMQAIWYETPAPAAMDAVVRELSSSWGQPNGQSAEPDIRGWALWKRVVAWHRAGMNVWVADNPNGQPDGAGGPRLIVYARRDSPRDPDFGLRWLGDAIADRVTESAAQIAAQDSNADRGRVEPIELRYETAGDRSGVSHGEPSRPVAQRLKQLAATAESRGPPGRGRLCRLCPDVLPAPHPTGRQIRRALLQGRAHLQPQLPRPGREARSPRSGW